MYMLNGVKDPVGGDAMSIDPSKPVPAVPGTGFPTGMLLESHTHTHSEYEQGRRAKMRVQKRWYNAHSRVHCTIGSVPPQGTLSEDEGVGVDAALASCRRQDERGRVGPHCCIVVRERVGAAHRPRRVVIALSLCGRARGRRCRCRQGEGESEGVVHVGVRTREGRVGPRCRVVVRERVRGHRPCRVVIASSKGERVRVCRCRRQRGRERRARARVKARRRCMQVVALKDG